MTKSWRILTAAVVGVLASSGLCLAAALDGEPYIHDPATVTFCDGKWYTFGTGNGGIMSDDGWTWHTGAVRPGGGAAPDILKIGDRYLVVYGATGGGLGGGHNGRILTMWNKTLDPKSPDFKYTNAVVVASSDGVEDCDAIDPSLMMDGDNRLWLSYGTFFGFIRVVELDPKTGLRVEGNQAVNIAIDCEGTELAYRDGWYYLFGTHGTCCNGATSTYNIVVGRSKKVTGPYLDNMGQDMLKGGGKMVVSAGGRYIGAGHFGRVVVEDGVEKFSCHYEADLDRSGRSVLEIRPLMWKDGWPVAGDNIQKETTFKIQAAQSGMAFQPAGGPAATGNWTVTPVPNVGGYPGMSYMMITAAGGTQALAVNATGELTVVGSFTSAPEQLWRVEPLVDGSWRLLPKSGDKGDLALTASGGITKLAKYDFKNLAQHWNLSDPEASKILRGGTYEIQSERSGFALELAVTGAPIGGGRGGGGFGGGRGGGGGAVTPVAIPDVAQVSGSWPTGNINLRLGDYMLAAHQKWTVAPVANAGGDPGATYYKITIAGTDRALAATPDAEVVTVPAFDGKPEELWSIEQLTDGTYRVAPRVVPNGEQALALTAIGGSTPTLVKFDPNSPKSKWNFKNP